MCMTEEERAAFFAFIDKQERLSDALLFARSLDDVRDEAGAASEASANLRRVFSR